MAKIYKVLNQTSGGGSGSVVKYDQSFNATTSWGTASGGFYSITILQSTHGAGTEPIIEVYELIGSDYFQINPGITINGSGDVEIFVTETPDNRFAGKIVII